MDNDSLNIWSRHAPESVKKLEDFIEQWKRFTAPREVNTFLFRGTSREEYDLVPSLPRCMKERKWLDRRLIYQIEQQATLRFQAQARLYADFPLPPPDKY